MSYVPHVRLVDIPPILPLCMYVMLCVTCQAGLPFALFVGRPLNRGLADVVLLVPFLYASVQTLAPCTAHSSLHGSSGENAER